MTSKPILVPPPFVGDLSTQDAAVLATMACGRRVLEFGAGGSTQIFATVAADVVCVETDGAWIEQTRRNLLRLGLAPEKVAFRHYEDLAQIEGTGPYDLVFVDGQPGLRKAFALVAWRELAVGGLLVFHDDRTGERDVAIGMCVDRNREIAEIHFDIANSNMMAIRKRPMPEYVNWNVAESRAPWEHGSGEEIPEDFQQHVAARTARHFALEHMVPVPR